MHEKLFYKYICLVQNNVLYYLSESKFLYVESSNMFWCIQKYISTKDLLQGDMKILASTLQRYEVLLYIMVNYKIKCNSDIKNTMNFYSYAHQVREHDGLTWYSEGPCTPALIMWIVKKLDIHKCSYIISSPGTKQSWIHGHEMQRH